MADLRDVHGNPIRLTDEQGNPVQLTDEYGNPVHVTGIASKHPVMTQTGVHGGQMGDETGSAAGYQQQHPQQLHYEASSRVEIQRSNSSSSSEDDEMGGIRKKKGLKDKIKDKLTGGKHKEEVQSQTTTHESKATTTSVAHGQQHTEHEKKTMMEKIKEKFPGHHSH
ncbi:late embryogenesis abundant protein [Herrania umbratica]|uniref:Late embryogenesis abundant protein n=1 Tax=Herrania umbratica TaxID=108875 RepID=A0A6J1AJ84_9ROSI|nr:late embryogenesis abundant protein [Herrania umbratica]